jgi:asparagine synthase (glutamine-hydrolysing)
MCGLAGFVGFKGLALPPDAVARSMADAIAHRGPDDWGTWIDAGAEVALAHRRLSIVDLSAAGHQPMHSESQRFVIVFNGEVYNHAELRAALESEKRAPRWRGHSDTEVLLAAAEAWGLKRALERSVGMFALALFDRAERLLYLARDRIGEKPLYYGRVGGSFAFASEVKSLTRHPLWTGEIDRDALALYLRYGNVPAPHSIYCGIRKLPPGVMAVLDCASGREAMDSYWDAAEVARNGLARPFRGSAEEAAREVESLLLRSIKDQMVADVPLGAFLSGGIDSSTTVALMQSLSDRKVKTFSIGFHIDDYDEAPHARAVARHLGTEHTELYVTERDALDVIPKLPAIYCEPFADPSQIPTYLVSKLARQAVTVALSGDGGDELFSGYTRYRLAHDVWRTLRLVPRGLRRATQRAATALSVGAWDLIPGRLRPKQLGDKVAKAASVLSAETLDAVHRTLVSHWHEPQRVVLGAREPELGELPPFGSDMRRMMLDDLVQYLPNDILVKVDRAAMAVSLETRVPMLDHRLVAFSWSLPDEILRLGGQSKWPLRHILRKHVPDTLMDRPKMGFGVPIDRWLRGELRDWAEALLSPQRLAQDGLFEPQAVRAAWEDHAKGVRNNQYPLWCVLVFQEWLDANRAHAAAPTSPQVTAG